MSITTLDFEGITDDATFKSMLTNAGFTHSYNYFRYTGQNSYVPPNYPTFLYGSTNQGEITTTLSGSGRVVIVYGDTWPGPGDSGWLTPGSHVSINGTDVHSISETNSRIETFATEFQDGDVLRIYEIKSGVILYSIKIYV